MSLTADVKKRDGFECQKCDYSPSSNSQLEAHHIVPSYLGGDDEAENMISLCNVCHNYAPTEVLPREITEQVESPTDIHVDNYPEIGDYFERMCAGYVATELPPTVDLYLFGMEIIVSWMDGDYTDPDESVEEAKDTIRMLYKDIEWFEKLRDPEVAWIFVAKLAGHLGDDDTGIDDILSGDSGQLRFDME